MGDTDLRQVVSSQVRGAFPCSHAYHQHSPIGGSRLSREAKQYEQLQTTLGAYRFVMGQPRQEDLIRYLGPDVERLRIDLGPAGPTRQPPHL